MRMRRTVCALLLVVGSFPFAVQTASGAPPGFVTADGPNLMVDGHPWRAIGVNFWDMEPYKALGNDLSGCYYQHADLDAYFDSSFRRISQEVGATVVRTFGFREQYTAGGRDFQSTDKLLYYAQKYNVRVIPVLGDQFAACGIPGRGLDWYQCEGCVPGYMKPTIWGTDYRSYVVNTVTRYKDSPVVAFWELMNEPLYAVRDQYVNPNVLLPFTRDIVSAIREDAGDTDHLITAGTAQGAYGNQQMTALLLDCPASGNGGCADIAQAHDYGGAPLNGIPMASSVGASLVISNSYDNDIVTYPIAAPIDGWTQIKTSARHNGHPDLHWTILLSVPPSEPWRLYVDDALATTVAGPALYTFETDTNGFTATGATIARTTEQARTGLASLAVDVPAGVSQVRIKPPILPAPHTGLEVWLRLRFGAPAPDYGKTTASMLHASVVSRKKPFFLGEAGIAAQVPDSSNQLAPLFKPECVQNVTLAQRASMFDTMLSLQTDADHRSGGLVAWDWKDPSQMWTAPDGSLVPDKGIGCYTITPGDPAVEIIARHARKTNVPPLPPPAPLGEPATTLAVLRGPPALAGAGSTFPVQVRVTHGGSPVRDFKVVMDGVCTGSGKTNAIGVAAFNCKVTTEQGSGTVVTEPDPSCECSVPPVEQEVFVGRSIKAGAIATVVERGAESPVTVLLTSSDGGSLAGTRWSLPECGRSGVVTTNATTATVATSCPTGGLPVSGALPLRIHATDPNGIVSGSIYTLLIFDRLYADPTLGDCIGLAVDSGWIGGLEQPGSCAHGSYGTPGQWFAFQVPAANRQIAFRFVDTKLVVTAAQGGSSNRKLVGQFEYSVSPSRAFTAVVSGRDGNPRALAG